MFQRRVVHPGQKQNELLVTHLRIYSGQVLTGSVQDRKNITENLALCGVDEFLLRSVYSLSHTQHTRNNKDTRTKYEEHIVMPRVYSLRESRRNLAKYSQTDKL